eukprot:SAG31_NODE_78_length_27447_cov_83.819877_17_plen_89_part_00
MHKGGAQGHGSRATCWSEGAGQRGGGAAAVAVAAALLVRRVIVSARSTLPHLGISWGSQAMSQAMSLVSGRKPVFWGLRRCAVSRLQS